MCRQYTLILILFFVLAVSIPCTALSDHGPMGCLFCRGMGALLVIAHFADM
jgi:hypothetical protein